MRVLVHLQGNARPAGRRRRGPGTDGVIVITNRGLNDEGLLVLDYLQRRDTRRLGHAISGVTHAEVLFIDEVASSQTVEEVLLAFAKARTVAEGWADGAPLEIYAGLTGGTKPMVIGGTIATLIGGLRPYYVSKPMIGREEEVHDLGHLSGLSGTYTWATTDRHAKANLAHLEVLMALEADLGSTGHTAADIAAGVRTRRRHAPFRTPCGSSNAEDSSVSKRTASRCASTTGLAALC